MVALSKGMGKKNPIKTMKLPAIKAGPAGVAKSMKGKPFSKAGVFTKSMPKSK